MPFKFEKLEVWKDSVELSGLVHKACLAFPKLGMATSCPMKNIDIGFFICTSKSLRNTRVSLNVERIFFCVNPCVVQSQSLTKLDCMTVIVCFILYIYDVILYAPNDFYKWFCTTIYVLCV